MATQHIAKARVVKVAVGSPDGNRVARIIFAGDVVPTGVDENELERLVDRGLIEKVEIEGEAAPFPEGDPNDGWKADELKAYAAAKSIDLAGAKNKPEILAAIIAAAQGS